MTQQDTSVSLLVQVIGNPVPEPGEVIEVVAVTIGAHAASNSWSLSGRPWLNPATWG